MFSESRIDLKKAGGAGKLALDYLEGKKDLAEFYSYPPSLSGFKKLLSEQPYADLDRDLLSDVLLSQAKNVNNTSNESALNIKLLQKKTTYTVTTGHQLCLFTGPLYFIYKIATTVNLAARLKTQFPSADFVPAYWMASEDHDFEEINHFHLAGQTIRWETGQKGAVGRFSTASLGDLAPVLSEAFGKSENGLKLQQLFTEAYLQHNNLADATRYLVNALFGNTGLVIIDGDHPQLKKLFTNEFSGDLFDNEFVPAVSESTSALELAGYRPQVNARETNVFLLEKENRLRIDKHDGQFSLSGTNRKMSENEMREIVAEHVSKLSPNVVLRPLYQQKILPNIAYVGGPGELAYWLQLRKMFLKNKTLFPVLVPRNFFSIIEPAVAGKLKRSGLSAAHMFKPLEELVRAYLEKEGKTVDLSQQQTAIAGAYQALLKISSKIDPGLTGHVNALEKKHFRHLEGLEKKLNRALKNQSQTAIRRITSLREAFFPDGIPQERHLNFSNYYLIYGEAFIGTILRHADPFIHKHFLLQDEQTAD